MINHFKQAILLVHDEIIKLHDELEAEHLRTKPTIFGNPTKRHHQIIGASRALGELGKRINKLTKED